MSAQAHTDKGFPVSVLICVGADAMNRFGRVLRHLAVGLVDQSIHVRLASSDPRIESLRLGPIQTVHHEKIQGLWARRRINQLLEVVSPQPPTIVHATSGDVYGVAKSMAENFEVDAVYQVTSMADCGQAEKMHFGGNSRYVAGSVPLVGEIGSRLGIPPARIELIRPGILASNSVATFVEPKRVPTILCTSPLERGCGIEQLIEALVLLQKRDEDWLTFFLGTGRSEDKFRRLVDGRGLMHRITFVHPSGDILQALNTSDLFIVPESADAFHVDSLHAMGAGMAVLARPSSVCDHFQEGVTSLLCSDSSPQTLASAIEKLLTDRSLARELAQNAQTYIREHHSMSAMAEAFGALYRKLALSQATFPIREP